MSEKHQHTELRMRHNDRLLLLQRGVEPSALDETIGLVDSHELAVKVAEAWNAYWQAPSDPTRPSHIDEIKMAATSRAEREISQADSEG